jgi:hypothetical protein
MSPMKVRTLFGRQLWLMYEVRIQKPLRTGVEAVRTSTARRGAVKQLRRRMCSTRKLVGSQYAPRDNMEGLTWKDVCS